MLQEEAQAAFVGIRLLLLFGKNYGDKNLTFKCFHMRKKVQVNKQLLKERSQFKEQGSWKTRSLLKNNMSVYMKGIKVLRIGNLTNRNFPILSRHAFSIFFGCTDFFQTKQGRFCTDLLCSALLPRSGLHVPK